MTLGARRGIVVFDLDGTLLRGDSVCELLARPLGRIRQMRAFEQLESEAEIAGARQQMLSWYAGHTRETLCRHLRAARWAPGAHNAVRDLQEAGILVAIASITWHFAVEWFADQLGIDDCLGTDGRPDGGITHVWGRDKALWLNDLVHRYRVPDYRVAAVGDSSGDIEMLRAAHLRYFVGDPPTPEVPDLIHIPDANLHLIAKSILALWAGRRG
jgi:HAD superfamily phosphoserine phosphatase-like hydrolase